MNNQPAIGDNHKTSLGDTSIMPSAGGASGIINWVANACVVAAASVILWDRFGKKGKRKGSK